jgi:phage-related protein
MVNFGSMNQATADLLKKVSEQKKAEELQKEKEEIQTKLDVIEKNIEKLEDKKVAQTTTPAVGELPAPAKSKTLMYVGLIAGGIVVTYLLLKFSKKE